MENSQNYATLEETSTLEDNFSFKKLPPNAQAAFFADANPLWPKNKDGKRVKPRRKRRAVTKRTADRRKKLAPKPSTKKKTTKKTSRKKSSSKKSRNSGMTYGQKLALGAVGVGILTIVLVKKPFK